MQLLVLHYQHYIMSQFKTTELEMQTHKLLVIISWVTCILFCRRENDVCLHAVTLTINFNNFTIFEAVQIVTYILDTCNKLQLNVGRVFNNVRYSFKLCNVSFNRYGLSYVQFRYIYLHSFFTNLEVSAENLFRQLFNNMITISVFCNLLYEYFPLLKILNTDEINLTQNFILIDN